MAVCGLISLLQIQPARAGVDTSGLADLQQHMTELGITSSVQDGLVAKILAGGSPDSEDPNAQPINVVEISTSDYSGSRLEFADGSVRILSQAKPVSSRLRYTTTTGCTVNAGTGYANYSHCTFGSNSIYANVYFVADFSILGGVNNDYISSVYGGMVRCFAGTCDGPAVHLVQAKETLSRTAIAMASTNYTLLGQYLSRTLGVTLTVGGNSYSVSEF